MHSQCTDVALAMMKQSLEWLRTSVSGECVTWVWLCDAKSCSADHLGKLNDEVQVAQGEACGLMCWQVVNWLAQLVCALAGVVGSTLVNNRDCIHVQQEE